MLTPDTRLPENAAPAQFPGALVTPTNHARCMPRVFQAREHRPAAASRPLRCAVRAFEGRPNSSDCNLNTFRLSGTPIAPRALAVPPRANAQRSYRAARARARARPRARTQHRMFDLLAVSETALGAPTAFPNALNRIRVSYEFRPQPLTKFCGGP